MIERAYNYNYYYFDILLLWILCCNSWMRLPNMKFLKFESNLPLIFHQFSINIPLHFNPLSANSTKWSNTLKQFIGNSQRIVWVSLTILQGWHLKDWCFPLLRKETDFYRNIGIEWGGIRKEWVNPWSSILDKSCYVNTGQFPTLRLEWLKHIFNVNI